MRKSEIIKDIIEMQENNKQIFIQIAKKEDLEQLKISDLNMIYNATYIACNY